MDKLEKRADFLAIPNLASFLAAMNAVVGVMTMIKPEFPSQLALYPEEILRGQVWRLVTFLFIPPALEPLWMVFWLILFFTYMRTLESEWGDFKFNLFCAIGAAAMGTASLILEVPASNLSLVTSLFLAFSRLNPDLELLIFFVLPVKVKWLGLATWFLLGWNWLLSGWAVKLSLLAGLANYLAFFGAGHWTDFKIFLHRRRNRL